MLDGMRRNAQSWMVKALFAVIIIVFVFAFGMGGMGGGSKGNTLATVNEEPILVKDYERIYRQSLENLRQQNPSVTPEDLEQMDFKRQVLAQMVNSRLLLQQAEKLGLHVTATELRRNISRFPAFQNEQNRFDPNVYRQVLSAQRMSPAEFESGFTRDLLMQKIRNFVTLPVEVDESEARSVFDFAREQVKLDYMLFEARDHMETVEATEEEIQAFYDNNKQRFEMPAEAAYSYLMFTPGSLASGVDVEDAAVEEFYEKNKKQFVEPEQVKARHILFRAGEDASESEVEAARANAMKAMLRAREGEDFAELARELSEGPSAPQGGDLGWFSRQAMVEDFAEAAFALEPGKISEPVRTRFGWHVIKVEDRKEHHTMTLAEARDRIRTILAEERAAGKLQDMLDQALEQIIVGESLQEVAEKLDIKLRDTGLKTVQELSGDLGLEQQQAAKLFEMVQGEVTDTPIPVEEGYLLATKTDFQPADYRPLEEVREMVAEAVKHNKAMEMAKEEAAEALRKIITAENPANALDQVQEVVLTAKPVGRGGVVENLGMNPNLVSDAFAAREGEWLTQPYMVNAGYALARLAERVQPEDEAWEEQKEFWVASLEDTRKNELFQAYLTDLRAEADVRVVTPTALE